MLPGCSSPVVRWMAAVAILLPSAGFAENWAGFRGPTGQGISREKNLPLAWSLRENLLWRTEIPGIGWSSPIVWGDRVFVTTATPDGTSCRLLCLDAASGNVIWDEELFRQTAYRKLAENSHATPTPVTDGKLVYAAFNGGRIVAVDFAGNLAWQWRDSQFVSKHGLAVSPILYRDTLIMPFDGNGPADVDNIGFVPLLPSFVYADGLLFGLKESGVVTCRDAKTGQTVWKERLGGTYGASPVLAEGRLYCLADDGSATVIAAGREFRQLARNVLEGPCKASPAISGERTFVRSQNSLFCVAFQDAQPTASATYTMKTYTYKTVGDVKIQADVYRPEDTQPRSVLVWLHGGALMTGSKRWVPPDLMQLCRSEGYCLVSANYRLAPQVKLPEIINDLRDLMKWVSERGPVLFHADASRIVVSGGSAGGYLTMMTGILQPRPRALVAYYGYGDVDGPWYTTPSEFYRQRPLVSKQDAYLGMTSEVVTEPAAGPFNRGRLYLYLRQNGLWTKEVTGFDATTEKNKLDPYCPVRNITPQYPPIIMLHGTEDTDVPCQESRDMAGQLKKHGVRYEFFEIPGGNHGLNRGDKQMIDDAMARAREFIKEYLGSKPEPR